MDIVKTYSWNYPEDKVFLIGGSAAYLWIKDKLGKEHLAPYVEVHINTTASILRVEERLRKLLPEHTLVQPLSDTAFAVAKFKNGDKLEYAVTINYRDSKAETKMVDGYRIETLSSCFTDTKYDMDKIKNRIKIMYSDTTEYRRQLKILRDRYLLLKEAMEK